VWVFTRNQQYDSTATYFDTILGLTMVRDEFKKNQSSINQSIDAPSLIFHLTAHHAPQNNTRIRADRQWKECQEKQSVPPPPQDYQQAEAAQNIPSYVPS